MFAVVYDRALNPPTYDVVSFLMWAEYERIEGGEPGIAIQIAPGPRDGFAANTLWPPPGERQAVWDAVAWPMITMLPSIRPLRLEDRPDKFIGHGRHLTGFEHFLRSYRIGIRPLRPRYEGRREKLITLTLRESAHWPMRNSKVREWIKAAYELQHRGHQVVIVRDTLKADEPLGGMPTVPDASRNLQTRATLYRQAAANLFVSNGPAWFCLALDAPTVILRPATDGAGPRSSSRALVHEYKLGDGLPNAPKHQRLLWQDDLADNIVKAAEDALSCR